MREWALLVVCVHCGLLMRDDVARLGVATATCAKQPLA